MTDGIYLENATVDAPADRGWLLGHFKPAANPRHSEDVEIKWGIRARGNPLAFPPGYAIPAPGAADDRA